tara:strand:- start:1312 stop:1452 length:141 start_codon:yes stop_codon:yes gene_type:complete
MQNTKQQTVKKLKALEHYLLFEKNNLTAPFKINNTPNTTASLKDCP